MSNKPIQAPRYTDVQQRSLTETARVIGEFFGWQFDENDYVLDREGKRIAYTIEDLAEAAQSLGWIKNYGGSLRVDWQDTPHQPQEQDAAERIRGTLTSQGPFPTRHVPGW